MPEPRWIDTHIHVSDRTGDGSHREHLVEDLMAVLDRCDADLRFIISPDAQWNRIVTEDDDGVPRAAEFIRGLTERAPYGLYGSCLVNPHFLDASLRTMEACFENWGFVQLGELLQYMMDYDVDTDEVEALVRRAVEYDVPVQVHISTSNTRTGASSFGTDQLRDLFGLVERVPEAKYILAHAVGMPDDDPPVVDEYLDMIDAQYGDWPENFWAEIRDFSSPGVRSVLDRVPHNRLIAGTDWTTRVGPPFPAYGTLFTSRADEENPFPPCVGSFMDFLRQFGATEDDIEAIGHRNAGELLGIDWN
ncbi:MAG: amidohydrolase family protein [Armatimonadota bacterium]|jgi:predicted TIM-barrel fold metal-dependent hydrolase